MTEAIALLDRLCEELGCPALREEPLARHTSFRIGGPADRLVQVQREDQLAPLLALLEEEKIPWFLLGRGSNLLAPDEGWRGAALSLEGEFREMELLEDGRTLRAGAGVSLSALCAFARDHGLSGLEFAWGIPGSVGGAAVMNAGAYGGEMKDVLRAVTHLSPAGERQTLRGEDLDLGYRHSRYSGTREIVLWAEFALQPGEPAAIAARMEELMGRRKARQPYDLPSAGSVFKRPEGYFAGALIEEAGLKGRAVGGAQVSPKHAGFIVNNGGASCRDVLDLMEIVQREVRARSGVTLEREVKLLGEE